MVDVRPFAATRNSPAPARLARCVESWNAAFPPLGFLIAFAVCSVVCSLEHPLVFAAVFARM